jgi:TP901 family phage tail tape measure protein
MSNRDLTLSMKLYADTSRWIAGFTSAEGGARKFTSNVRREFSALQNTLSSVEGRLASIGVTVGATAYIMQSARMDKNLTQIGQTANASESDVAGLRKELFRMSQETGQNLDDLQQGFNNAVQAGLGFNEALPVINATNKAVAVTGAQAEVLTGALTVASTAFDFDLTKPNMALSILDKMTVAGRLGNAELENLSSIFGRIGPNASAAGFGFDQTLAFVEGLSQIERQPERLATLADSTLRLFTNLRYMKDAQGATGVKFFDADGSRRDAMEVLADIKSQYDKLETDKARALYIQKAFGSADLDTIKGLRILLSNDMLAKVKGMTTDIAAAGGTLQKDLDKALDNSVDQVGRFKAALREAADGWAQPINESISNIIKYTMASKKDGGLGMDGQDMLLAAGGGVVGTALAARYGGKMIGSLASKFGSVGTGVATGKALEAAAGVTPVYVVNMPGDFSGVGMPGVGGPAGRTAGRTASRFLSSAALLGGSDMAAIRMMGMGAMGTAGLGVAGAGAAGYGVGSLINKAIDGTVIAEAIGRQVAIALAPFSANAREALMTEFKGKAAEMKANFTINIDREGRAIVKSNNPGTKINVNNGPYMVTP